MRLEKIAIKRYRSIHNLSIDFKKGKPIIICGPNNVGKTNFIRALELFFSLDPNKFNTKTDIPYHIEEGTRGGGRNVRFESVFIDENNKKISIDVIYKSSKDRGNFREIKAREGKQTIEENKAIEIIQSFKFFFIEASNINIPFLIAQLVNEDVLPALDKLRSKQSKPLELLDNFISKSKEALSTIEKDIGQHLLDFMDYTPGIDTTDWKIKIIFPEYLKLRHAISGLIDFTLYDKSDRKIETKGSGIQRILLMSILKYISDKYGKNVILAIDEPEAFLQPSLQKKVFKIFNKLSHKMDVIVTTHSPHFVDIEDDCNVHLFEAEYEKRSLARRKNEEFYKIKTVLNKSKGIDKIQAIKEQLGMQRNDAWEILRFNILVEGQEDKDYLISLIKIFNLIIPNILVAGGVSKIKGFLQFLDNFCDELNFTPKVLCILDHDNDGRNEFQSLNSLKSKYRKFNLYLKHISRCDGNTEKDLDYEIEDYVYPEIILEATNKFLKKNGYRPIKKSEIKKRFEKAYNKNCILNFLSQKIKSENPDREEKPLNDEGLKRLICKNSVDIISKKDISEYDKKYAAVRKFIQSITDENNLS